MASHWTPRRLISSVCASCRQRLLPISSQRTFTTTTLRSHPESNVQGLGALSSRVSRPSNQPRNRSSPLDISEISAILDGPSSSVFTAKFRSNLDSYTQDSQPYRFHVYATKHNTHITFVQPQRPATETASSSISTTSKSATQQNKLIDVLLSVSTGNIGFKKAGRGSYDAAYQLAAYVLTTMKEKGMLTDCRNVEVVLRGFGAGREAVTKALLGSEGRLVRPLISSVRDATRLKQGGPRSKKPRRLG